MAALRYAQRQVTAMTNGLVSGRLEIGGFAHFLESTYLLLWALWPKTLLFGKAQVPRVCSHSFCSAGSPKAQAVGA